MLNNVILRKVTSPPIVRRLYGLALYRRGDDRSKRPLGARLPTEKPYVDKYPARDLPMGQVPRVPIVIGVNWYSNFDEPVRKGTRYWIGLNPLRLGALRGGHCVCVKSSNYVDPISYYKFFDQGAEGACVGFGSSRAMALMNGKLYFSRWLWDYAKLGDQWSDTNPGDDNGTSVDAAMRVLKDRGHVVWSDLYKDMSWHDRDRLQPIAQEGVSAYRWVTTVDEVRAVLQSPLNDQLQAVPILNSWGLNFPHITWLPYATLGRLLKEDGEAAIPVDR